MTDPPVPAAYASPEALAKAVADTGYLADEGLATAGYLALKLNRPLFLEGDPGVGKTAFAEALAQATGATFIRLQCYEGLDATPGALRLGLPAADPASAYG